MTNIAKLQIFDVALDYDAVFDRQNVPAFFYPKDINAFKQIDYRKSTIERFLDRLPLFHP
jgi:hypothetical protein